MPERGQTEVVGYVLIFAVIVLTVALVTLSGQAGLADLRDNQRTANVEAGFSLLADNVEDISQGGAPSRATELGLSGGRISLGEPVTMTVRASNASGEVFNRSRSVRPIVYESAGPRGGTLTYESGTVVLRGEEGGTALLREPRAVLGTNATVLSIANTSFDRQQLRDSYDSVDQESRILIRTERRGQAVIASATTPVELTVTVDSPRATAWKAYLDPEIDPTTEVCSVSGGTVTCTYTTDRVTVVETKVAVQFE
jgi:hypothetical protein